MLVVTGIEAEILRCTLQCKCGRQFGKDDFLDIDNVVTLRCGGLAENGCGATPLVIVLGSDFARELWAEERDYAESETVE